MNTCIKKFITFLTALLLSTSIQAECIKGDCENGQGVWIGADNYSYVGQFQNGKQHGQGIDRRVRGSEYLVYNGSFKDNSYNGSGILYINNGNDNPYIFGTFKDGELEDGTEALMKYTNGIEVYYKVESLGNGSSSLKIINEKTFDAFCSQNPTYIGCIDRFLSKNQGTVFALMAIGYMSLVINNDSNSNLSFNDISQGIKILADTITRRRDERAQEFADRVARKLGLPN